jgi:hypothetical protein
VSNRMMVWILRVDGSEEKHEIAKHGAMGAILKLIGADTIDSVNLRKTATFGDVMLVDDNGWDCETVEHGPGHIEFKPVKARKPINAQATKLYHAVCRPGTTHQIAGDVAICWDKDFA